MARRACSSNPLRIPHSEIDKLACQAQSVGIFAAGELSLRDAYCEHFYWIFLIALDATALHSLTRCSHYNANYYIIQILLCQANYEKI